MLKIIIAVVSNRYHGVADCNEKTRIKKCIRWLVSKILHGIYVMR